MDARTGKSDTEICGEILESCIRPLFSGSDLSGPFSAARKPATPVSLSSPSRMKIYAASNSREYFLLHKYPPFSDGEKRFLRAIMEDLHSVDIVKSAFYLPIAREIVDSNIARLISPEFPGVILSLIRLYSQWASQTYEGERITHTTGVYLDREAESGVNFFSIQNADFIRILGTSLDTILAVDKRGNIMSIEDIAVSSPIGKKHQNLLAPISDSDLAMWTSGNKVGLRLTRHGEIMIFQRNRLLFAKRRGYWRSFPHSLRIEEILPPSVSQNELEVRKATYLTLLDIAFRGQGACIGILPESGKKKQNGLKIVRPEYIFGAKKVSGRTKVLSTIVGGRKFFEIPRELRAELCAIDGAVVVDSLGEVLTVGAILKIRGNPEVGGARTAAAQALARHGTGMKVSEDGYVAIYHGLTKKFTFG